MQQTLGNKQVIPSSIGQQRSKLLITITSLLMVYLLGYYSSLLEGKWLSWWSDLFWTFAALATGWRCLITARKRPMIQERKAWFFFALASLSWFVGMLIWDYYEVFGGDLIPFPSVGDWFFMGYAVFFIIGLFYYRTQAPGRQFNMIQVANLGLMVCSIAVICYILLSQILLQSEQALDYKVYALSHAVLTIACFVFGVYCYWFYVWRENRYSFGLILASLFIFAATDTLYAFQLLGQTFNASSFLNIYWLLALALQYWAAFEQDFVTQKPSGNSELSVIPKAPKYEAIMPALCLFSVLIFILFFKQHLDEDALSVIMYSAIAFAFFLTLREWYSNRLESQLMNDIQAANTHLADAQQMAHLGHWEHDLLNDHLYWSAEIYRIFDVDDQQAADPLTVFRNALHPEDKQSVLKSFHDSVQKAKGYEIEYRIIRPDGTERVLFSRADLTCDKDGQAVRMNGIVQDISERKKAEQLLERNHQTQLLINQLLNASMAKQSLRDFLQYAIEQLTRSPVISLANMGSIFLANPINQTLQMVAQHRLDSALLVSCAHLPFGKCLCGAAAATKSIQFTHCLDHRHEITFEGMQEHGHYCVPILSNETVLGVVNLYLEHGHQQADGEIEFLETIANTLANIIERKHAEEELLKLSRAVESSSSAVFITDADGNIEYINPKYSEITGYTSEQVIGKNPRILKSGNTEEQVYADLWETVKQGGEWKGELQNRKKDGSLYWSRSSISGVKDSSGQISHFIAIQDDVTHEYELSEQLSYQASHDKLTGLINRHEFERQADLLLRAYQQHVEDHAFCFMDIDQFKVINDNCGHAAGDELLHQLGRVLSSTIRKHDTLARLGGDEFGLIMENCSLENAHRVAEEILKSIQEYQFIWEGQQYRVGISLGLVAISELTPNLVELLKQADAACYTAKELGRNRVHVYHPEDTLLAQRRGEMQWVARINQALQEDRFCLYAQPIVALDKSHAKHYELLIRMLDESGDIVPPGAFLPAAERYNLIEKLDTWVIENAFRLMASHLEFSKSIDFLSINLSGPSLTNRHFLEFITSQLRASGVDASKVCFEVTETVAISNLNAAITFISVLKQIGCRFALDDFGSGLSSFGYLKNLPVNYLKIDGMFVKDIADDPIDHAMVKSINDIGHVMGMKTVAEFVENDIIRDMLAELGIDYGQGYGLGRPVPFIDLINS